MGINWFAQKVWTNIQIQWRHLPGLQLKHCIWLEVGSSVILSGHHTRAAVTDWNHISMNKFLPNPGPMSPSSLSHKQRETPIILFKHLSAQLGQCILIGRVKLIGQSLAWLSTVSHTKYFPILKKKKTQRRTIFFFKKKEVMLWRKKKHSGTIHLEMHTLYTWYMSTHSTWAKIKSFQ